MLSRRWKRRIPRLGGIRVVALLLVVTVATPASALAVGAGPREGLPTTGAAARLATSPTPQQPWTWPVTPPIRIVGPFVKPPTRYSAGHRGVDVAVVPGAPVVAAEAGVVRHAGWLVDRPLVSLDHGGGVLSAIEPVEASVAVGEVVARGAPIGRVSSGAHCADACVHFGVRVDGEYVSPLRFLGGVPRAVLLPIGRE